MNCKIRMHYCYINNIVIERISTIHNEKLLMCPCDEMNSCGVIHGVGVKVLHIDECRENKIVVSVYCTNNQTKAATDNYII